LFSRNGDIKLGDFGTAKTLTEEESKGNEILGTICYMSPELLSE
jgi:serine/threonine protein kinase